MAGGAGPLLLLLFWLKFSLLDAEHEARSKISPELRQRVGWLRGLEAALPRAGWGRGAAVGPGPELSPGAQLPPPGSQRSEKPVLSPEAVSGGHRDPGRYSFPPWPLGGQAC